MVRWSDSRSTTGSPSLAGCGNLTLDFHNKNITHIYTIYQQFLYNYKTKHDIICQVSVRYLTSEAPKWN